MKSNCTTFFIMTLRQFLLSIFIYKKQRTMSYTEWHAHYKEQHLDCYRWSFPFFIVLIIIKHKICLVSSHSVDTRQNVASTAQSHAQKMIILNNLLCIIRKMHLRLNWNKEEIFLKSSKAHFLFILRKFRHKMTKLDWNILK